MSDDVLTLRLTRNDIFNFLAHLERISGGNLESYDKGRTGDLVRADAASLKQKIEDQTGITFEEHLPRDLTEEAKKLREKYLQGAQKIEESGVIPSRLERSTCSSHILSLTGRCVTCGVTPP